MLRDQAAHRGVTPANSPLWRRLVVDHAVQRFQVYDVRLADHGVTHILTFNADDFRRYPGIVPVTPAEAAARP
jgi:hypothetical protein